MTETQSHADSMLTADDRLLAGVLRRLLADDETFCPVDEARDGRFIALVDSSWFDVTPEEAAAMKRAKP